MAEAIYILQFLAGLRPVTSAGTALSVSVTRDAGHAANADIVAETGGTVTATSANATVFSLAIPAGALVADATITLTPVTTVTGYQTSGGVLAAVDFAPTGLQFLSPATLTVTLPAATDPNQVITVGYGGPNDELFLQTETISGSTITMTVNRFSGEGRVVYTGNQQDTNTMANSTPSDPQDNAAHQGAAASKKSKAAGHDEPPYDELEIIAREWYNASIKPKLKAAETDDANLPCIAAEYLTWKKQTALASIESRFATEIAASDASLKKALENAFTKSYQRCTANKDIYEAGIMWDLLRVGALLGFNSSSISGPAYDKIAKCVRFEVTFSSIIDGRSEDGFERTEFKETKTIAKMDISTLLVSSPNNPGTITDIFTDNDGNTVSLGPYVSGFRVQKLELPNILSKSLTCGGAKPQDPPHNAAMIYSLVDPGGAFWNGTYNEYFHDSEYDRPSGWYGARGFVNGQGDIYSQKTYSQTQAVEGVTLSEETHITIKHAPQ